MITPVEKRIFIFGIERADNFNDVMERIRLYGSENFKSEDRFNRFLEYCDYDCCIDGGSITESNNRIYAHCTARGFSKFTTFLALHEEGGGGCYNEPLPFGFITQVYGNIIIDVNDNFLASITRDEIPVCNPRDMVKKLISRIQTSYNDNHCIITDVEDMVF